MKLKSRLPWKKVHGRCLLRVISVFAVFSLFIISIKNQFSLREQELGNGVKWLDWKSAEALSSRMVVEEFPGFPFGRARFDNQRILRIYDFIQLGKEWARLLGQYDICLATQSSIERIYWLPEILSNWKGPISLAVHLTNEEEWFILILFMDYLKRCHSSFGDQVSLHLAVPASVGPFALSWGADIKLEHADECVDAKQYMHYLLDTFPVTDKTKLALKEIYPQNHMRNIARKACGTDWTFSTDVDIIPSSGMAEALQQFYESLKKENSFCAKCAYVIPTFELNETQSFPTSKKEIVNLVKKGSARQFHGKVYARGHNPTSYKTWTTTHLEDGPVKVSHPIKNISSQPHFREYEPFYVGSDSIPPYDERFMGYGFTRNTQFQEALYAGWSFSVLTPIYSIHWGLQSPKTLLSPKKGGVGKNVRNMQKVANYKRFKKIEKEMKLREAEGLYK